MTATLTAVPDFTGASQGPRTEPLTVVRPAATHSYSIVAVNGDTEIEAKRMSSGTISVKFRCPITGSVTQLDLPESDLLRLCMHAESARRSQGAV